MNEWPSVKALLVSPARLYQTDAMTLKKAVNALFIQCIGWQNLLPDKEKDTLEYYPHSPDTSFSSQVMRSLKARTKHGYESALYSSNIINKMIGRVVVYQVLLSPLMSIVNP